MMATGAIGNQRPRRRSGRTSWRGIGRVSPVWVCRSGSTCLISIDLVCSRAQMSSTQKGLVDPIADQGGRSLGRKRTTPFDHSEFDRRGRQDLGRPLVASGLSRDARIDGATRDQFATTTSWWASRTSARADGWHDAARTASARSGWIQQARKRWGRWIRSTSGGVILSTVSGRPGFQRSFSIFLYSLQAARTKALFGSTDETRRSARYLDSML